jgi:hypothetical protein
LTCNSELGHNLEANAKSDPSVLMAVKTMADQFPSLASSLIQSQPHVAYSDHGSALGYFKNGDFRVKSKKLNDGSVIQPTDLGRKSLLKLLIKTGHQAVATRKAIASFDAAPENKRLEIAPGLEAVKWRINRLETDISRSQFIDPLIPAKTAYEFLACHLGPAVYEEYFHLSQIRSVLKNRQMDSNVLLVERLTSNKYEPFHGICFEGNDPYAKVQIRLFGWLAFRVHFLHLSIGGPRYVYTHQLDSGDEDIDVIND